MKKSTTGITLMLTAALLISSGCASKAQQADKGVSAPNKTISDVSAVEDNASSDIAAIAKEKSGNKATDTAIVTKNTSGETDIAAANEKTASKSKAPASTKSEKHSTSVKTTSKKTEATAFTEAAKANKSQQTSRKIIGQKVPFKTVLNLKVGVKLSLNGTDREKNGYTCIIKSLKELNEFYKAEQDYCKISSENHPEYVKFFEKYDNEFFKNNSLVFVYNTEPSGSRRFEINDVTKENGKLIIWSTTYRAGAGMGETADFAAWRTFVEVANSQINNVTTVVSENVKIPYQNK